MSITTKLSQHPAWPIAPWGYEVVYARPTHDLAVDERRILCIEREVPSELIWHHMNVTDGPFKLPVVVLKFPHIATVLYARKGQAIQNGIPLFLGWIEGGRVPLDIDAYLAHLALHAA